MTMTIFFPWAAIFQCKDGSYFAILGANFAKISVFNFLNTTIKMRKIGPGIC